MSIALNLLMLVAVILEFLKPKKYSLKVVFVGLKMMNQIDTTYLQKA